MVSCAGDVCCLLHCDCVLSFAEISRVHTKTLYPAVHKRITFLCPSFVDQMYPLALLGDRLLQLHREKHCPVKISEEECDILIAQHW